VVTAITILTIDTKKQAKAPSFGGFFVFL